MKRRSSFRLYFMRYPGCQRLKTDSRTVYCGLNKVDNTDEATGWLKTARGNFNIKVDLYPAGIAQRAPKWADWSPAGAGVELRRLR
jgi:hypothetical protein